MGISLTSVTYVDYNDAGQFVTKYLPQEPYSDQSAMRTWASPSGAWFADDSGTVYSPSTLDLAGSLGTRLDDLTFTPAGAPVALYGGTLTRFASQASLRPTGFATLAMPATWVVADADDAVAFRADAAAANGYAVQVVPLADFAMPQPGTPIAAKDRIYAPDDVEVAGDGTVLLLSKTDKSIFRFDPDTLSYLPTIPLLDGPASMAYVPAHNAIYVGYASGRIDKIDLPAAGGAPPAERPFAALAGPADTLAAAGGFLFTANPLGSDRVAYSTFDANGTLASLQYGDRGVGFAYSPVTGKIYFVGTYSSSRPFESVEVSAAGKLGPITRRSGFGNVDFWPPVDVSPDGATVLLGSGNIFDAATLQPMIVYAPVYGYDVPAMLGNRVAGITRLNGDTFTVRALDEGTQFQRWAGSSYAATTVAATAPGIPLSVLTIGGGRLLGIYRSSVGVPVFRVMDAQLQTLGETTPPPPAPLDNATIVVNVSGSAVEGSGTLYLNANATNLGYGQSIARVEYDFDYDGAKFDSNAAFTPPGPSPIGAYVVDMPYSVADGPSTRTIALRLTDSFGQTAIRTKVITFANVAPTATFSASLNDLLDRQSVTYSFDNARDASPADAAAGFRYSFDFNNDGDFADAGDIADSTSPSATFRWAAPGTYVVRGRIVDKDGGATLYSNSTVVSDNTNLAAGKPTTASGSVAGYPPSNATDASPDTEWVAPASDADWLQVDLGAFYRVTSIVAVFNQGVPDAFQVLTGTSASTPTNAVYSRAGNTDATTSITLQGATTVARYVRLQFSRRTGATSYRVGDFRIYGTPAKPPAPTYAYWGPLTPLNEGATASLQGNTFPLVDGQTIAKWEWDYDYDGTTFDVDAIGQTVQVALPDSSVKRLVAIRATDNYGQAIIGRATLSPVNVAPTATLTSSASGLTATVTFSKAADPSAADVAAGFSYSFDFNNDGDFADAGDVLNSTSAFASYAFAQAGSFTIHGRISDKDGGFTDYTSTAVVSAPVTPPATPARLPGTAIGTPGSIGGNTVAKAFDGSLATYVDLPVQSGAWAGLDLGSARTIASVKFAPRATLARRMTGGAFQASNSATFASGVVTLGTIATPPAEGVLTTMAFAASSATYRYVRYLAPAGSFGNVAELQFFGTAGGTVTPPVTPPVVPPVTPPTTPTKLTGTAFGTAGSIGGNGFANALDGSLSTYVDSTTANGATVGLDLGSAKVVKQIRFAPRATLGRRMVGGFFQGSNVADFSVAATLFTIASAPVDGILTSVDLTNATAYRYVRYVAPAGSFGNVAEVQFYG